MIHNDVELAVTQERIVWFQNLLAQFRVAARVEEFPHLSGAYVAEVERMHREVMDYLTHHASLAAPGAAPASRVSGVAPSLDEAAHPAPT